MIDIGKIEKAVQEMYLLFLKSKSRTIEHVEARVMFYVLAREHTGMTFSAIARHLGKTHATVIHGLKVYKEQFSHDKLFIQKKNFLLAKLDLIQSISTKKTTYKPDVVNIANKINDLQDEHLEYLNTLIDIKIKSWNYANNS